MFCTCMAGDHHDVDDAHRVSARTFTLQVLPAAFGTTQVPFTGREGPAHSTPRRPVKWLLLSDVNTRRKDVPEATTGTGDT